jgi:molybdate transport system substrate-binding protein
MMMRFVAAWLALLCCISPARAEEPIVIFAAASLKNALDEAVAAYPGTKPVVSYAASSVLARQIERGAPASIFISADRDWMDYLEKRGHVVPGSRSDLLANRLVLIAPASSRLEAHIAPGMPLARWLGKDGRLALADPDSVPAGMYAKAALQSLGIWDSVRGRIAAVENVRVALLLVARAEAPLSIVYATDAREEPRVRVVGTFADSLYPPIVYPVALINGAPAAAADVLAFLHRERARRAFAAHGFTPLN